MPDEPQTPPTELSAGSDPVNNAVVGNMFEIFVLPELSRRGSTVDPREIDQFLVELKPDGDVAVRLGEEALLEGTLVPAEGGGYYLQDVAPQDGEVGPNSGWVAYIGFRTETGQRGGTLAFDFRRNRERADGLLRKADGFLAAAIRLGEENISPAIDSLYSAAELSVQAMMSLQADNDPRHELRRRWLRRWTKVQNSPASHSQMLDDLANLRPAARYEAGDPTLKKGRFDRITATVREMIDTARTYAGDRSPVVRYELAGPLVHEASTGAESTVP